MTRFGHGLVLGKFYPLHAGHEHLISVAASLCDRVTVEVLASSRESIPLEVRAGWLRERFPMLTVVEGMDEAEVDFDSPAAWDEHIVTIAELLDSPVDAVFTSDPYGEELARRLNATWHRVDPERRSLALSATAVRADVPAHWWALCPAVREWFCRRVVLLGAESTGTTTLVQALAAHYRTVWVPEYGRTWSEVRPGGLAAPWHTVEFDLIAAEHQRLERDAMRAAPRPLVISDTDALATTIWHERYLNAHSVSVGDLAEKWTPDLYLLTGDEIPFVQDGLRDGEHLRHVMQQRFRERLASQAIPWTELHGTHAERLSQATGHIDRLLAHGWNLADPLG